MGYVPGSTTPKLTRRSRSASTPEGSSLLRPVTKIHPIPESLVFMNFSNSEKELPDQFVSLIGSPEFEKAVGEYDWVEKHDGLAMRLRRVARENTTDTILYKVDQNLIQRFGSLEYYPFRDDWLLLRGIYLVTIFESESDSYTVKETREQFRAAERVRENRARLKARDLIPEGDGW